MWANLMPNHKQRKMDKYNAKRWRLNLEIVKPVILQHLLSEIEVNDIHLAIER